MRFYGRTPAETWFAMAAEDSDRLVAIGAVTWDRWGRAWGAFDRKGEVSPFVMHRTAVRVIGWLREVGEPALRVVCDDEVEGARFWLERLGFVAGEEGVWMKCLASKQP